MPQTGTAECFSVWKIETVVYGLGLYAQVQSREDINDVFFHKRGGFVPTMCHIQRYQQAAAAAAATSVVAKAAAI